MDTAAERQHALTQWMQEAEFLSVTEACRRAEASPATIRRDFAQLVAQGVAERHRGGVRRQRRDALAMVPFAVRESKQSAEKSAIAREAASLLQPGDAVFVDGGSSTLHLANHLGAVPTRVITNSLRLAVALGERPTDQPIDVHLSGGYLVPRAGLLIGPQARSTLSGYHTRWAFISVGGIGPDGVYNTDETVADVEQTMIANAERTVVLVDHTKLGVRALCQVAPLSAISLVITDAAAPTTVVEAIRQAGVEVRLVTPPDTAPRPPPPDARRP